MTQPIDPLSSPLLSRRGFLRSLAVAGVAAAAPLSVTGTAYARVGARPQAFRLPAVPGTSESFDLGEHLGERPVVLCFWATWCDPCKQQLPIYQALYERLQPRGLRIAAISMDGPESISQAASAVSRLGLEFPVVSDLDTAVTSRLNPRRGAPFTVWIDRSGRIVQEREGFTLAERSDIARGVAALVRRGSSMGSGMGSAMGG